MRSILVLLMACTVFTASGQIIPEGKQYLINRSGDTIYVKTAEVQNKIIKYEDLSGENQRIKKEEVIKMRVFDPLQVELNEVDGRVEYQEVIEIPEASAKDLYAKARLWFADTYKDSKEVLELDDPTSGVLVGTGWSTFFYTVQLHITTKIEVKDGRYRYTIYNMQVKNPATSVSARYEDTVANYYSGRVSDKAKAGLIYSIQDHINSLKAAMSATSKSDNW